jgi:hypothetical protein
MKSTEFRKLIREEVKKALNENYRDPDENLDVLIGLLKKNKTKDALELVQAVRDGLDGNDLESAFDEAVEMWFDEHSEGSRRF